MKSFLRLSHIKVENANTVAGMIYGFPAMTNFLGFVHALSKKLRVENDHLKLGGCAVIVHDHQIHAYRSKSWKDAVFCLTRNPPTEKGVPAAFNEEGRMHLTISLIIECHFNRGNFDESRQEFEDLIKLTALSQRIAGGIITAIGKIEFVDPPEDPDKWAAFIRREKRKLLPGFLLVERSDLLAGHFSSLKGENPEAELIEAWLDFVTLKYKAQSRDENSIEEYKAEWSLVPKPAVGWIVPLNVGYRAISELYPPGQVKNVRDIHTPFRFVESAYTIGQWLSPHRIKEWDHLFWRYHVDPETGWYLCKNGYLPPEDLVNENIFE